MSKEELLNNTKEIIGISGKFIPLDRVEEFFSQNVCIPKGENRHPYANSLHEWLEDTTIILEFHDGYCIKVNQ